MPPCKRSFKVSEKILQAPAKPKQILMSGSCFKQINRHITLVVIAGLFLAAGAWPARGNMVNLNNWTPAPGSASYLAEVNPVGVVNPTSAVFSDGIYIHNGSCYIGFTGNLATTPGTYYDISFTLQNLSPPAAYVTMNFGSWTTDLSAAINAFYLGPLGPQHNAVNFNFITLAQSPATAMDFFVNLDAPGGGVYLSNLSVVPVPELTFTAVLLVIGLAGLFVCVRRWRCQT
jgi:hypothetical protein